MCWHPIKSAPRDGTPILGWSDEGVAYVCWWPVKSTFGKPGAWAFFDDPTAGRFSFHPTHWRPLLELLEGVATARKSGGETTSDSRQGNVEQSHIRSSRTGTGVK